MELHFWMVIFFMLKILMSSDFESHSSDGGGDDDTYRSVQTLQWKIESSVLVTMSLRSSKKLSQRDRPKLSFGLKETHMERDMGVIDIEIVFE